MLKPERRTRADLIVAALIAVGVVVLAGVIWLRSDARGTSSQIAAPPAGKQPTALAVPETLSEAWRAESDATTAPLITDGTLVTADGNTVVGRDPVTGAELWQYTRDRPLCRAVGAWGDALAVYRDGRGCSQVTSLDGGSGDYVSQRSSDADAEVALSALGQFVISRGPSRLELWRSDLVRTLEYGRVDAPVNPRSQPRSGCTLLSADANATRAAILERCPDEDGDRLTITATVPKDDEKPEDQSSTKLPVSGAQVLAISGDRTALYQPAPTPQIVDYDGAGRVLGSIPLDSTTAPPASAVGGSDVPGAAANPMVAKVGAVYTWWSGNAVVALGSADLTYRWSIPGALGPGTLMAGQLLVPVAGAIAVVDPATGTESRRIPVDRPEGTSGPITTAVLGTVVLEQRGSTVTALR